MKQPNANNMRFLLDFVCEATDIRLSYESRLEAAHEILELDNLREQFEIAREYYREIANRQTDGVPHGD